MSKAIVAAVDAAPGIGVTFGRLADSIPGFRAAEGEPMGEISTACNGHSIVLWAGLSLTAMDALHNLTSLPGSPFTYEPTSPLDYLLAAAVDGGAMRGLTLPVLKDVAALRKPKRGRRFWAPMLVGRRSVIADRPRGRRVAGLSPEPSVRFHRSSTKSWEHPEVDPCRPVSPSSRP